MRDAGVLPLTDRELGPLLDPIRPASPVSNVLGLAVQCVPLPAEGHERDVYFEHDFVATTVSGSGRRWLREGLRWKELSTAPRMVEIYGSGLAVERVRYAGHSGKLLGIELNSSAIGRWLPEGTGRLQFRTRHELFDSAVADLLVMLHEEGVQGCPGGPLYNEGLTLSLLNLLVTRYGSRGASCRSSPRVCRFSPLERQRIQEFIDAELAGDLRIERLASVVDMSPFHFARVFKETWGRSPHAYVIERRLHAACMALAGEGERSIADIASGCGFSSQSHFTESFRRRIGTTPARWRSA